MGKLLMPEILAPAGSEQAVVAAVRCGANAVYLGGKALNARRNAANFTENELRCVAKYCHERNVKLYLTLNTLVGDGEFKTAYEAIECACNINADALILQDLGLAAVVKKYAPGMAMHASTQMSVQSADGIRALEQLGFCRAVLPRELSLDEIKKIAEETRMELEVFVHGALCMSVSGQCLMSAVIGSRSGNRGLCAQPCRLPFGIGAGSDCLLSLKDLSLVNELPELAKAGVLSFKIEGRMKRPEYVAAAVTACRESLAGKLDGSMEQRLRAVFSRSGFTNGYYYNKLGADMFGTRQKEDVAGAAGVLTELSHLYDNENPLIAVDFEASCAEGKALTLSACALGKKACAVSDFIPEAARTKALGDEDFASRIAKCGSTQFYAGDIKTEIIGSPSVPASAINALRRDVLDRLSGEIAAREALEFERPADKAIKRHSPSEPTLHARFFKAEQIPATLCGISRAVIPANTPPETVMRLAAAGIEPVAEIPRAVFSSASKYIKQLAALKAAGVGLAAVGTLDGIEIAKAAGLEACSFFGMNIFNTRSLEVLSSLGVRDALLSCELNSGQISALGGEIPRGVLVYGKIPLMLTRNCPVKSKLSCAECGGKSALTDRTGAKFPVICSNGCCEILNSRPLYLADRLGEIRGVDYRLLYFTNESAEECAGIIAAYKAQEKPSGEFTRGLYFRGVE